MNRKILVPLATLAAAGAIAVGSGANFTSHSENTISSVTSGSLKQTNSKDGQAIFNLTAIKPGDVVNGSLTLTNTGTLPAKFSLTEGVSANGFIEQQPDPQDHQHHHQRGRATTARSAASPTAPRTTWAPSQPGSANVFTFRVALDAAADDVQRARRPATYGWDSVQLDGETTNQ